MNERRKEQLGRLATWAFDRGQKYFLTPDVAVAEQRGARLGMLWYRLDRKHRERAHSNLALAYPEKSADWCREVARCAFRHYGRVTGDFLRTPIRTDDEVRTNADIEGMEHLAAAEAVGKGVIVITGHLGNFERFGHICSALGRKITVVARDANQSSVQARIAALRAGARIDVLSRGEAALPMVRKLRRKELVAIMPDQNDDECFVPFFGQPCGTVLGPGVLHQRTSAPIVPAFCMRTGPGKYRVIIHPPIDLENVEADPIATMAKINTVLESAVREYPDQWLWMHDRWKSARIRGMLTSCPAS